MFQVNRSTGQLLHRSLSPDEMIRVTRFLQTRPARDLLERIRGKIQDCCQMADELVELVRSEEDHQAAENLSKLIADFHADLDDVSFSFTEPNMISIIGREIERNRRNAR